MTIARSPFEPDDEQIAAAQLRIVVDQKLGRETPDLVQRIADSDQPNAPKEGS